MTSEQSNPFVTSKQQEFCPECKSELNIKSGSNGAFWACSAYPDCQYTRPLSNSSDVHFVKILDDVCCPECEGDLAVKTGKYGMFIGCMNYPECHFTVKENDDDDYVPVICPQCNAGELHLRTNKKGHGFYACDQYPKCDYLVNHKPVYTSCEFCQWPITIELHPDTLQCPECHKTKVKEKV